MPREPFAVTQERPHPYSRPSPAPQVPADPDPPTVSTRLEPNPASNDPDSGCDSENESWQDFLDESTHNGSKFFYLRFYQGSLIVGQYIFPFPVMLETFSGQRGVEKQKC